MSSRLGSPSTIFRKIHLIKHLKFYREFCFVAETVVTGGKKEDKPKLVGFILASVLEKEHKIGCGFVFTS
jgi:hypothetical protein